MTRSDTPDLIASALRRPRGSPGGGGARPGPAGPLAPWASDPPTPSHRKRWPGAGAAMSDGAGLRPGAPVGRPAVPAYPQPRPKPPLPRRPPWAAPGLRWASLCVSSPELPALGPPPARTAGSASGPPSRWPNPPWHLSPPQAAAPPSSPLADWRRSQAPAGPPRSPYATPLRRAAEERARAPVSRSTGSLAAKSQLYDIHPSKYRTRPRSERHDPRAAFPPAARDATLSVHEPRGWAAATAAPPPAVAFTFRPTPPSHVRQRIDLHPLDPNRYRASPARRDEPAVGAAVRVHSRSEPHIPASAGLAPSRRHLASTSAFLEGRRTSDTALVAAPPVGPPAPPARGSSFWTFSRSLDNLYACLAERRRGDGARSREGCRPAATPPPPPPSALAHCDRVPVVQLSRSPRRYAALSLSESAIFSRARGGDAGGQGWRVTPSITITDNELSPVGGGSRSMEELRGGGGGGGDGSPGRGGATDYLGFGRLALHKTASPASPVASQELDEILTDIAMHSSPRLSAESGAQSHRFAAQLHNLIDDDDDDDDDEGGGGRRRENDERAGALPEQGHGGRGGRGDDAEGGPEHGRPSASSLFERGRLRSVPEPGPAALCRRVLRLCRADAEARRVLSRAARVGYLSRGRGCLFLGFPGPASAAAFLRHGLDGLLVSPTYLSLREIRAHAQRLGDYVHELQSAGSEYDPDSRFVLNVSVSARPGGTFPAGSSRTTRRLAKIRLAPSAPHDGDDSDAAGAADPAAATRRPSSPAPPPPSPSSYAADTLILTPPAGAGDGERPGIEGRRARELALTSIQRELRARGVCLRRDYARHYAALCRYVETGSRPPPAAIYPVDRRTGRQFMCLLLPASEPLALGWVDSPWLLRDLL